MRHPISQKVAVISALMVRAAMHFEQSRETSVMNLNTSDIVGGKQTPSAIHKLILRQQGSSSARLTQYAPVSPEWRDQSRYVPVAGCSRSRTHSYSVKQSSTVACDQSAQRCCDQAMVRAVAMRQAQEHVWYRRHTAAPLVMTATSMVVLAGLCRRFLPAEKPRCHSKEKE
jgi:hypothetical protein